MKKAIQNLLIRSFEDVNGDRNTSILLVAVTFASLWAAAAGNYHVLLASITIGCLRTSYRYFVLHHTPKHATLIRHSEDLLHSLAILPGTGPKFIDESRWGKNTLYSVHGKYSTYGSEGTTIDIAEDLSLSMEVDAFSFECKLVLQVQLIQTKNFEEYRLLANLNKLRENKDYLLVADDAITNDIERNIFNINEIFKARLRKIISYNLDKMNGYVAVYAYYGDQGALIENILNVLESQLVLLLFLSHWEIGKISIRPKEELKIFKEPNK